MKGIDDPEFILLEKAREIKKRLGESEDLDELIYLAEGIVNQNFKGAMVYMLMAVERVDIKEFDQIGELMDACKKKRSETNNKNNGARK